MIFPRKFDGHEVATGFAVHGWGNPLSIAACIDPRQIPNLRARIAEDVATLLPRCEALHACLPDKLRRHRGYVSSQQRRAFELDVAPIIAPTQRAGERMDHPAAIRHLAAAPEERSLGELFVASRRLVCVGHPDLAQTREATDAGAEIVATVSPGGGSAVPTVSGLARPAPDTLAGWLAAQEEADRAAIGGFVLSRSATSADLRQLRHRLHAHHRLFVEAGAPALTWLFASWQGAVSRCGDVFVFAEPGPEFREPSTRRLLRAGEPWPRISVITVSYNQRDYLEQCLQSVLNQHYPNLEYIVVDGGSTDGSADLLRSYQARHGCFAHLVIEPDRGQSDGLNKGFRLATGEILTWVNSDDMLAPLALKRAALALRETGADMVAGTCRRVVGVEARLAYHHHAALPSLQAVDFALDRPLAWSDSWEKGDWFFQPEVLFTRDIWERAGGYLKPHLYWAMDWDLWLRLALAGARVVRIPDVVGVSREHEAQKTTSAELYLWQLVGILREFDDLLGALNTAAMSGA